jgi:hypothetical protein
LSHGASVFGNKFNYLVDDFSGKIYLAKFSPKKQHAVKPI